MFIVGPYPVNQGVHQDPHKNNKYENPKKGNN